MTSCLAPLCALAAGWGCDRLTTPQARPEDRAAGATVWGMAITGAWMALLSVVGLTWSPTLLSIPALGGLLLVLLTERWHQARPTAEQLDPPGLWHLLALIVVGTRVVLVATIPAFGWDFRYLWGLKARVFATAGTLDLSWLSWKPFALAHPDYPPLWSSLIAAGRVFGSPIGPAAAAWGAVIAAGLGAACWRIARPAGARAAALGAIAGAWAPVLLAPAIETSGSAGPLVAFLLAMAVGGLIDAQENTHRFPWEAGISLAALTLAKNEGTVMGVLLTLFVFGRLERRHRVPFLAVTLVPAFVWQLTVVCASIPRLPQIFSLARMVHRALMFPSALAAAATPVTVLEMVVLVLVLVCPAPKTFQPVRFSLVIWVGVAVLVYLTSAPDLRWHIATSFERVFAIPLPLSMALLIRWTYTSATAAPATPSRAPLP